MGNTVKIRALRCPSNMFGYISEIITQDKNKYDNAIFSISNIEIIEVSDPFQFIFDVLQKKPHGFQLTNILLKKNIVLIHAK